MKTLNRHNLALARLAPNGGHYLSGIQGIQVTPNETCETDRHQLLIISTVENGDAEKKAEFTPFILPRALALQMAKNMPATGIQPRPVKSSKRRAIETPAELSIISTASDEATIEFVAGDVISTIRVKQVGEFPDVSSVFDKKRSPVVIKIGFDPAILARVFTMVATFASGVKLELSADNEIMVISATNQATGQTLRGAIMPLRLLE